MDLAGYDLLATAVLLLNRHSGVDFVNTAAQELFGLSRRHFAGMPAHRLFGADIALEPRLMAAVNGESGVLRQDSAVMRAGCHVPVSLTIVPLVGQPWKALLEVRELEPHIRLDRSQQLIMDIDAQRESLRNLAHEVKNPLAGIRGAAQLLDSELAGAALHEYPQVIIAEVDRLSALVDRLIAPQGDTLRKTRFNIHEVCERVHALIGAEYAAQILLIRDYDASVPELVGDPARLVQALLNVARNAAQALTEGSVMPDARLVLRTRVAHRLALADRQARMGIVISVIDTGPGVPDALREKIFRPLVTGRSGGTGLGLSLAQEFVVQHGGIIDFESVPGHTEFRLILPLEPV